MKTLILVLPLLAILLVSGCTGSTTGGLTGNLVNDASQGSGSAQEDVQAAVPGAEQADAGIYLDVTSVKTDNGLYHSAEVMKLSAVIAAGEDVTGAVVTATGINGRMSLSKTMNLSVGNNEVEFEYQLPRCNVCGGIREGNYTCTLTASSGDSSSSEDITVEIRQ
jgi:hypothetical protein